MSAGFQPGVYGYEPNGNGDHVWVKAGFRRSEETYDEFVASHNTHWSTSNEPYWSENEVPLWDQRGPDWDDTWEGGEGTNYGVSETKFIRRGDSAYVIVEGPTWQEAEANANKLGGHLVTISDAEENQWLLENLNPNNENIWIGINRNIDGTFEWSSGDEVTFTDWAPGEPNTATYGKFWSRYNGKWDDASNYDNSDTSAQKGIAEIQLAPNNAPTGQPVITGTLQVGQTVTADISGVSDADNFQGWTPTYTYSWKSSSDNSTWTEIGTSSTYELTESERGKSIKVDVSYMDGYGTYETVNSESSSVLDSVPEKIVIDASISIEIVNIVNVTIISNGNSITNFSIWNYLSSNIDLLATFGSDTDAAIQHYASHGYKEGRNTNGLNAMNYLASNQDLLAAFGSDADAANQHYVTNGYAEGRSLDTFDEWSYLASNGDLISAYGSSAVSATEHYVSNGYAEGRSIDTFDSWGYLASNDDLISAFGSSSVSATPLY